MLLTLAFVAWVALNFYLAYDKLPFFPIEISWTLGATEANIWLNGLVLLAFPFVLYSTVDLPWYFYPWFTSAVAGLLFGDHLGPGHAIAVKHLLLVFLAAVWQIHDTTTVGIFLIFYFVRPVTKFILIATLIQKRGLVECFLSPWEAFKDAYAFAVQPSPPSHLILRVGGVWQWLVWGTLIVLIDH